MADQSNFDFLFKVRSLCLSYAYRSRDLRDRRGLCAYRSSSLVTLVSENRKSSACVFVYRSVNTSPAATVCYLSFPVRKHLTMSPSLRCILVSRIQFSRVLRGMSSTSNPSRPSVSNSLQGPLPSTARPSRHRSGTLVSLPILSVLGER